MLFLASALVRGRVHLSLLCTAFVLTTLACSGSGGAETTESPEARILFNTPSPVDDEGNEIVDDADVEATLEGEIVNFRYELANGDCFNEYKLLDEETEQQREVITRVDCRRPHDSEIYAELTHPGGGSDPYPDRKELDRWTLSNCYAAFEEFVGLEYEVSELEIGIIPPEEPDWVAGFYRIATCYVFVPGGQLEQSMASSQQ